MRIDGAATAVSRHPIHVDALCAVLRIKDGVASRVLLWQPFFTCYLWANQSISAGSCCGKSGLAFWRKRPRVRMIEVPCNDRIMSSGTSACLLHVGKKAGLCLMDVDCAPARAIGAAGVRLPESLTSADTSPVDFPLGAAKVPRRRPDGYTGLATDFSGSVKVTAVSANLTEAVVSQSITIC